MYVLITKQQQLQIKTVINYL